MPATPLVHLIWGLWITPATPDTLAPKSPTTPLLSVALTCLRPGGKVAGTANTDQITRRPTGGARGQAIEGVKAR
jgi:hypothetical protein